MCSAALTGLFHVQRVSSALSWELMYILCKICRFRSRAVLLESPRQSVKKLSAHDTGQSRHQAHPHLCSQDGSELQSAREDSNS